MNVGQLSASELKRKSDEATRGRGSGGRTNVQGQLPANRSINCNMHASPGFFSQHGPTFAPSMATAPASCTTATFDRNMTPQFDHNMNSVAALSKPFPNIDAAPFLPRIAAATSAPYIAPSAVPHLAIRDVPNMGAIANTPAAKFDPRINLYDDVPDDIPAGCVVTVAREHRGTIYYNRYTT
ncbi:hypothetical protein CAPTEDRAFT_214689 [Capitella teleta]|uniref:Uncharacterized protein n=1 Tax=Capitella teleta TaxID=283909 RepID=R7UG53_CAPTE|nr:hypothetical protein CAPTEDRAFT_214689 [Capitella teleta]|eukprot:ELU05185.1 hypothetical protein CAPTEDRAFT_214689 [Capitella teleta]